MDIAYLIVLQNIRESLPSFIKYFFYGLGELSGGVITLLFLSLFYWCIDKETGTLMLFSSGVASSMNQVLKNTFCVYRPWVRSESIVYDPFLHKSATGYSFPSGHTTNAVSFYGSAFLHFKRKSVPVSALCVVMVLLTAFARNFVTAHTPQDVLVAIVVSTFSLLFTTFLLKMSKKNMGVIIFCGIVFVILHLIYVSFKTYPLDFLEDGSVLVMPKDMIRDCYTVSGSLVGFLLGWLFEKKFVGFEISGSFCKRFLRFIIGVSLLVAISLVLNQIKKIFPWFGSFVIAFATYFFVTGLYPALWTRFKVLL